jgi:hypothetical protein
MSDLLPKRAALCEWLRSHDYETVPDAASVLLDDFTAERHGIRDASDLKRGVDLYSASLEEWARDDERRFPGSAEEAEAEAEAEETPQPHTGIFAEAMAAKPDGPDRSRPCWVFNVRTRGAGRKKPDWHRLWLEEFEWDGKAWRRTGRSMRVRNPLRGLRQADWFGKLPHQGRAAGGGRHRK